MSVTNRIWCGRER